MKVDFRECCRCLYEFPHCALPHMLILVHHKVIVSKKSKKKFASVNPGHVTVHICKHVVTIFTHVYSTNLILNSGQEPGVSLVSGQQHFMVGIVLL